MFKLIKLSLILTLAIAAPSVVASQYAIGTNASKAEIAGWDIDIRPDGQGLPVGSGSVADGEILYEEKCASCHGVFGEGEGRWPVLAGGMDTLTEDRPEKTVGSYWPYVSTLWDYIHRAMPFLQPQSLDDDEVYALTAYVLYLNELVEEEFVLSDNNFAVVALPNQGAFQDDPRPDTNNVRCMKNCRDPESVKVIQDSTALGVTPVDHLKPEGSVQADEPLLGEETYIAACGLCHDAGIAGAPSVTDKAVWSKRIEQGLGVLYDHAVNGYQGTDGVMPAKGGNASLEDKAVKAAVDHMVDLVNQ